MPSPTPAEEEIFQIREDLSNRCAFSSTQWGVKNEPLTDDILETNVVLDDGESLSYAWDVDVPADTLYWFNYPPMSARYFHVIQRDGNGDILQEGDVRPERMCLQLALTKGCRSVTVRTVGRSRINAFQIFGPGDVFPERTVWWTEEGEHDYCELMLFSAHFDDEILMMGGVLPIYAGEQKKDCIVVYMQSRDNVRRMEAIQGVWEMGVKREPICLDCRAYYTKDLNTVVALLRHYRPLVVVTHDVNGEYGHASHVRTSALIQKAVELAADPSYEPTPEAPSVPWQIQKLYIHLWPENQLELDIDIPLTHMNGRTAYEVAEDAFAYHKTQQPKWSLALTDPKYPIRKFGLFYSFVGPDSGENDMFENIVYPE